MAHRFRVTEAGPRRTAGLITAGAAASTPVALVIALAAAGAGSRPAKAHGLLVRTAPTAGESRSGRPSLVEMQSWTEPGNLATIGL